MAKTIFIVDDDPDDVLLLKLVLEKAGYRVVSSNDPEEALLRARQIKPDLIILDILMPKIDGAEIALRLREHPRTKGIPYLFLTALKAKEDDIHPLGDEPANTVLAKPIDPPEMLSAIRRVFSESEDYEEPKKRRWGFNIH